jgi:AcrR family transcriptional regulator
MDSGNTKLNLRDRQAASTREEILEVGTKMLADRANTFSHEAIAAEAGMGARTVYRHFPDQAELFQALWLRLRDKMKIKFPEREEDIAPFLRASFQVFEEHDSLVRAVLSSAAGLEVRERGGVEGRAAFAQSLNGPMEGLRASDRARVIAVFVAIYSAPFWQLLKDRGGLNGAEAQGAAVWLMEVLLDDLRRTKKRRADEKRRSKNRK